MTAVRSVIASSGRCARKSAEPSAFAASARSRPSARSRVACRSCSIASSSSPALSAALPNSWTSSGSRSGDGGSASARWRYVTATSGRAAAGRGPWPPARSVFTVSASPPGLGRQQVDGDPIRCLARTLSAGGQRARGFGHAPESSARSRRSSARAGGRTQAGGRARESAASASASAAWEASSSSRSASCAARAGSAQSPSTATARARAMQPGGRRLRRARTARPTPCELSWLGQAGVLATRRDPPPLELAEELQEQERVAAGRPLAGGDEARIGLRGQRLCREHRDRLLAQPAGLEDRDLGDHEQLVEQLLHRAGLGRPGRQHERQRHARQPAGEIDQPAQGGDIRPVCVVHGQQHGLCVGQIDREPVEPVQRGKRRLGAGFRSRPQRGRALPAPPRRASRASRSSAVEATTTGSRSCRTIPNGNSRSSSPPRADRTRRSAAAAVGWPRADSILPIPAGPSKTTAPPEPALAPASNRSTVSSSSSRSTSGASCTATTRF